MTRQRIVNICLLGLFAFAVCYLKEKWQSGDWASSPIYMLLAIIALAVVMGIAATFVVLPAVGDFISTAMLSSGEEIRQDEIMKAVAKIAAGDYEGAIKEYKKVLIEKPGDPFPVSEIAKIYDDKMGETESALDFLKEQLEKKTWTPDNAAFLMFRMVDVHLHAEGYDAARDILGEIIGGFPDTRHSANARHKIGEIEQLQFKFRQTKAAQSGGTL